MDIHQYLLASASGLMNTCNIYEDEQELILNCIVINQNSYIDYFRSNKDSIINILIETTHKILMNLIQVQNMQNPQQNVNQNQPGYQMVFLGVNSPHPQSFI